MLFLDSRLFLDEHRHELPEHLAHDVHTLLPCHHIVDSMAHSEKHRLHAARVRRGVQFGVALGNVGNGNDGRR